MKIQISLIDRDKYKSALKYILYISDIEILMGDYGTKIFNKQPRRIKKICWEK